MGTSALIAIKHNESYSFAQTTPYDGYPEGVGFEILNFLKKFNRDIFIQKLQNLHVIESLDDLEKLKENEPYLNMSFVESYNGLKKFLTINELQDKTVIRNELNAIFDSLCCEWAYIIDLDKNLFEVYSHYNKAEICPNSRFYEQWKLINDMTIQDGYDNLEPLNIISSYDLLNLPHENNFLQHINFLVNYEKMKDESTSIDSKLREYGDNFPKLPIYELLTFKPDVRKISFDCIDSAKNTFQIKLCSKDFSNSHSLSFKCKTHARELMFIGGYVEFSDLENMALLDGRGKVVLNENTSLLFKQLKNTILQELNDIHSSAREIIYRHFKKCIEL